jgi:methyl-accepting chemotaxis protein
MNRLNNKVMLGVLTPLLISLGLVLWYSGRLLTTVHTRKAVERARALTVFCEEIRIFISGYHGRGMFHLPELMAEAEAAPAERGNYRDTRLYRTIPVAAAWTAARARAETLGYEFRIPRTRPRNPDNRPRPGVEDTVVRFLEGDVALSDVRAAGAQVVFPPGADALAGDEIGVIHVGVEIQPDGSRKPMDAIRFFRAIRLTRDCLQCHGEPAGTPDPLGFPREGWAAGEVHGAFEIIAPLGPMRAEIADMRRNLLIGAGLLFALAWIAGLFLTRRVLERPIQEVVRFSERLGQGDFRGEIPVRGGDEIGAMSRHLNASTRRLRRMVTRVSAAARDLSGNAGELARVASDLAGSAGRLDAAGEQLLADNGSVAEYVDSVAAAADSTDRTALRMAAMAEEMAAGSASVSDRAKRTDERVAQMARSGEEMRRTVTSVAAAAEEMTASLGDVAGHTDQARKISREASDRAGEIGRRMDVLKQAGGRIDRVVALIRKIADQTHLLALNATIEAAGAGAAGRGFAVVAAEVKALARSSAESAGEIADEVEAIQAHIATTVQDVATVAGIIERLAGINATIAMAAGEQSNAAVHISRRASENARLADGVSRMSGEAAELVADIARGADETAKAAAELAKNVESVAGRAGETARGSASATRRVAEMGERAREIRAAVGRTRMGADQAADRAEALARITAELTMAVDAFQAADEKGRGGENAAADSALGESSSESDESGETGADERLEGNGQ